MLKLQCQENTSKVVSLPDVEVLPMMLVVQYIYTGVVDLNNNTVLDVLALVDYFDIPSLLKLCCTYAKVSKLNLLLY